MQVKENVNASNFLPAGNRTGIEKNSLKADNKSEKADFSSFLVSAENDKKQFTEVAGRNVGKDNVQSIVDSSSTTTKAADDSSKAANDSSITRRTENTKQLAETERSAATDGANNEDAGLSDELVSMTDSVTEVTGECQEAVLEAVSSILQMVMEEFQLLPEEMTDRLTEFGMEADALLTEDGIKEFFLNMENADVSDLLVDEELNQKLQEFVNGFDRIVGQMQISVEELGNLPSDSGITALLTENALSPETVTNTQLIQSEQVLGIQDESGEAAEEPEVFVSEQGTRRTGDAEYQTNGQKKNISSEILDLETKPVNEAVEDQKEGFQNPILQAIDDAVNQVQDNVDAGMKETVSGNEIIKQIVEQVRVNMNQDTTSMELQLYPEHLGKIQIHVVSKEGVVTARIAAETEAARQAIEGGLSSLKDALEQQNLKVDAIEVMVSTTGFERQDERQDSYKQESSSGNRKKLNLSELDDDVVKEEEAEAIRMKAAGNSVSYIA